jgi:hypothetical protein
MVFDVVGGSPQRKARMFAPTARRKHFPHDARYLVFLNVFGIVYYIVYS